MSARMKLANCSGVIGIGSIASPERRCRSAGEASALLISALSRFVISCGSFVGPTMPYHCTPSKPLYPDSSKVGTPGISGWRSKPVTARSEEHTSELQSRLHLVCRLLLEKKKKKQATD